MHLLKPPVWCGIGQYLQALFDNAAVAYPCMLTQGRAMFGAREIVDQALLHNPSMAGLRPAPAGILAPADLAGLEMQNPAQVFAVVNAGDTIGPVDRGFSGDGLHEARLTPAREHELIGGDSDFLADPERMVERTALQRFEQWTFARVRT